MLNVQLRDDAETELKLIYPWMKSTGYPLPNSHDEMPKLMHSDFKFEEELMS
jgi:hypothetical protein